MSDTRYTVRRLGWHQSPHGDHYTRRLPTAEPVAHFDNFDDAEYDRRGREHRARIDENPFRFGGAALFYQTSLDGPRLHDWLLDGGIDPPADQLRHRDWKGWWDAFAHTWTEEQLAHAWHGLDKVRFFDVIEEPVATLHPVLEVRFIGSGYHDCYADREGGRPVRIYRLFQSATAECDRLNQARRRGGAYNGMYSYLRHETRRGYETERGWRRVEESNFYEVAEAPGDVPRHAGVGFLVQRLALDAAGQMCRDILSRDTGSRVPLRVFRTRDAAEAYRDALIADARQTVNPFQVLPLPTIMRAGPFRAELPQLRLPLPCPTEYTAADQWREWWDLCQDDITPEQRTAVWNLFDDHPLFEVLAVEVNYE
jgi:hypothetical protein